MKNRARARGQSTLILILFLPILLLISGVIVRSGTLMLEHSRIQSHCDKKILDTLKWQGRGLENLGKINPVARQVINARRVIDIMLAAGTLAPPAIPPLIRARLTLMKTQKALSVLQEKITAASIGRSFREIRLPVPQLFNGKIIEHETPALPFASHALPSALRLHVQKEAGFEDELGAPLDLDGDFDKRQFETMTVFISSEKFIEKWMGLPEASEMKLRCAGHIKMHSLEQPWRAELL